MVQRRVVPTREPVVDFDTGVVQYWIATWGVFLIPTGYGGAFARVAPEDAGAVINVREGEQDGVGRGPVVHLLSGRARSGWLWRSLLALAQVLWSGH